MSAGEYVQAERHARVLLHRLSQAAFQDDWSECISLASELELLCSHLRQLQARGAGELG